MLAHRRSFFYNSRNRFCPTGGQPAVQGGAEGQEDQGQKQAHAASGAHQGGQPPCRRVQAAAAAMAANGSHGGGQTA